MRLMTALKLGFSVFVTSALYPNFYYYQIPSLVLSCRHNKVLSPQKKLFSPTSLPYSTMSNMHLSQGSACPILQPGVLRIYNMRFCPYAERTLLVLNAKNIKYELVNVHLRSKPDWFLERNPFGKVPVLEQNGKILYESLATSDYLDEVYRAPTLYPEDPWERAIDKCLIGILDEKFVMPMTRSFYKLMDPTLIEAAFVEIRKGFQVIENEIANRGTKFLGGNKPGMVDYMIWPWFERIPCINSIAGEEFCLLPKESFPLTINYIKELEKDWVIQIIQIPTEQHAAFFKSFLTGSPSYDIGIEAADNDSKL